MLLSEILKNIIVKNNYSDRDILDIKTNSKEKQKGCLYFCIKGNTIDGHLFADEALRNGALYVVTEKDLKLQNQIIVDNSRIAYSVACANYFNNPQSDLKFFAVTGTNGKTSVATIVKEILCDNNINAGLISTIKIEYNKKNYVAEMTTPDSYYLYKILKEMKDNNVDVVCMEASSQALDQERLYGITYDVSAFTNLTQDHLDYHKTMEKYYLAKKKLFDNTKKAVINIDNNYGNRLYNEVKCDKIKCSIKSKTDFISVSNIELKMNGVDYNLRYNDDTFCVHFAVGGEFSVENSLLGLLSCLEFGVDIDNAVKSLSKSKAIKGRNELIETKKGFIVIIDYAHTPDALKNLLTSTRKYVKGRVIVVFGCGGNRDKTKRAKMGAIAVKYADLAVITSDNPRAEKPGAILSDILKDIIHKNNYVIIENRNKAIRFAIASAKKNDAVILAGKGHEEYQVFGDKKIYYSEERIVRKCIK